MQIKPKKIEKIDIYQYWRQWIHSGTYKQEAFFEEIFKNIEKKINEIIEKLNEKQE